MDPGFYQRQLQMQQQNQGLGSILKDIGKEKDIFMRPTSVKVVTREEWGARAPLEQHPMKTPVKRIGITFSSGTSECSTREECARACREIQDTDMDEKKLCDISYSWMVGGDGAIYEGRGWKNIPNVSLENPYANFDSMIDVVYIGDFTGNNDPMQLHQLFVNWLRDKIDQNLVVKDFEYA